MPNFIFNPETFVTPGHGSDPGEWNDDDRKDITTLRYLYPEIAHWGDLAIGSAFGSYSFDILEVQWAEWMIKRDDSFLNYCCWRQLYGEWQFHLDIDKVDQEASHLWKI
ncbi:hypothetical protein V7I38_17010 [Acinetobacter baumannii]|jgi:hypothetical protein|uniref:Uncharacterized protein n=10 Tax=Acinetobacter baumannii TaxID=470 RepID=A0AAP1FAU8_ACIBA|nr:MULTISPECIES: hypothetical protein [Gammaproteobacteria]ADX05372.1 Hypothetical protein ABK1_3738 [Acinetobacter baumannii 1656-2]AII26439.1 hypothetical protein M3Q_pABCC36 [Acinetobacter baumannii TYTH-1]AMC17756.1 hypothetical protein AXA63_19800 [Acinetobacter baumannii]AOX71739.1 hypothetical protein KAB01_03900 [Acinetobacter baumannii]AOX75583.1 hypothetical protein KAB02_03916 [Acinetobacter baumannii]